MIPFQRENASPAERAFEERRREGSFGTGELKPSETESGV